MKRRKFLTTSIGMGTLIAAGCSPSKHLSNAARYGVIKLKGSNNSEVTHWDVVTIGNLSRNRYWGESEEKSLHPVICTTIVIAVNGHHVIVDPSLKDERAMAEELQRRTGLTPEKIDIVFVTHEHEDHYIGMPNFPNARWLANPLVAASINANTHFSKKVEPAGEKIYDVIDVVHLPGHTPGTSGLRFDYKGLSVFAVGDAVATKDFWDEGRMYFKALDVEESLRSYKKIAGVANIIVPGHDNYFLLL
ncbi:MAG TPA: MBL fold metallo-hydrolase [Flavisolibacter sp.]|jgi:glyoxylase-like metal-dependent hydrolase (beta-lactamase superfamily II)|nr:MBL fold metallo-hydrolase [Flavisolibacter sp.]